MKFEELDTLSENLLLIFRKKRQADINQLSFMIGTDRLNFTDYIQILLDKGYLVNTAIRKIDSKQVEFNGSYKITAAGDIYFDLKHKENVQYWKRSVLIPAGVAIIVAFITTLLTLWLKALL